METQRRQVAKRPERENLVAGQHLLVQRDDRPPRRGKNVKVYAYNGDNFNFNDSAYYQRDKTGEEYAGTKTKYDDNYYDKSASPLTVSGAETYNSSTGKITVTYNATFPAAKAWDIKALIKKSDRQFIIDLIGYDPDTAGVLDSSNPNFDPNVEGYLWFLPVVFQYDLAEDVPDDTFEAILSLPGSARVGDTYAASDVSQIGPSLTVKTAALKKRTKGAIFWQDVITWPGKGAGQNSGGVKNETAAAPGEIEYQLIVTTTDGKTDTDTKTIKIVDKDEELPPEEPDDPAVIDLTAILDLPATVYEGHSVRALDQSKYTVDGENFSAARMYAEGRANNSFTPSKDAGASSVSLSRTEKEITWPKVGSYEVALRISASGKSDTDTKPIEVLKTPDIIDSLSGAQKENRKQVVSARIATNPLYPVKSAWIEIKEKSTGESVKLSLGSGLVNSSNIKTRAINEIGRDQYFTDMEVPFLSKYTEEREFTYTIYAQDTRGQTATATKDFTVVPDLPPIPMAFTETEHLRNQGENIAKIEALDFSESDGGDQLERTWFASAAGLSLGGFAKASLLAGYEDNSFGAGLSIAFDKVGVGPAEVKVFVKDVWTDETLPEYITAADYKSAESEVVRTTVENIAPVVSLSPKPLKTADVLLIAASKSEYESLLARKNEIQRAFIEAGADANVTLQKTAPPPRASGDTIMHSLASASLPAGRIPGSLLGSNFFSVDADTLYTVSATWTAGAGASDYPSAPYYITATDAYSGTQKWRYTIPESQISASILYNQGKGFFHDDAGKYLYFVAGNYTLLFDKNTGACLTRLNTSVSEGNYIGNNAIYTLKSDGIYRISLGTGNAVRIYAAAISGKPHLYGGKARFFILIADSLCIADFDPVTEAVTLTGLSEIAGNPAAAGISIDTEGKALVSLAGNLYAYSKDGNLLRTAPTANRVIAATDEKGSMSHIVTLLRKHDSGSAYYVYAAAYDIYSDKAFLGVVSSSQEDPTDTDPLIALKQGTKLYVQTPVGVGEIAAGIPYQNYPGVTARPRLFTFNLAGGGVTVDTSGLFATEGNYAGTSVRSDALYAVGYSRKSLAGKIDGGAKVETLEWPQSEDQILARMLSVYQSGEGPDIKAVLLFDGAGKFKANGSEFTKRLGTSAFTKFSDADVLSEAIVQSAMEEGDSPKKAMIMKQKTAGTVSSVSRSLTAQAGTTYYYEYDARGTETAPHKVEAVITSSGASGEKYYVTDVYEEDFTKTLTGFFKMQASDVANGVYNGANLLAGGNEDGTKRNRLPTDNSWMYTDSGEIKFTIPDGKQALLSFDYDVWGGKVYTTKRDLVAYYKLDDTYLSVPSVKIKSGYLSVEKQTGHFTYPVLLEAGEHVLKAYCNDDPVSMNSSSDPGPLRALIDNLKVEFLQKAKPATVAASSSAAPAENGYTHYSGYFSTPLKVISYRLVGSVFTEDETFSESVKITFSGGTAEEWALRDLGVYYVLYNRPVYVSKGSMGAASEATLWTDDNASIAVTDEKPAGEEEEEAALIYKKGELVAYNIGYSDYESDPSLREFWSYAHTPFNDGAHPEAHTILNMDGSVKTITGLILDASIDRFYVDGKYTVSHWQMDNTNRTGDSSGRVDYSAFNKHSNTETLTFYIEGGGEAPWITSIATLPDPVKEGEEYRLEIGVDDAEKDDLTLVTEVYFEGREVYRHYEAGIEADPSGNYPHVITDFAPPAQAGAYTVVCTVSDEDGTGLGDYRFTVVSLGRVEGWVNHTDQWDQNRKKYNLKLFGEEANRSMPYASYKTLAPPRARGTNVFWSGERFMLKADAAGNPVKVSCRIEGYPSYAADMTKTGAKNAAGEWMYEGSIWDSSMINKWGRTAPDELTFIFTAYYADGVTKTHEAKVIVDQYEDYWQLHRYF